jgi:ribosomal protein S18 acetylase RimI-like enzyme
VTNIIRMRRDMSQPVAVPVWPDGVALKVFTPADAPAVHTLLQLAYENGGGGVGPFDEWWTALQADSQYDPALCFTAYADETLVGVAQCWTSAFVKDLCVHPAWQHRGIGRALLLMAFRIFRGRGARTVDLKVQADNEVAIRVYQYLAMVPVSDL